MTEKTTRPKRPNRHVRRAMRQRAKAEIRQQKADRVARRKALGQ